MKTIVSTQSHEAWFEDYVRLAISCSASPLPPHEQRIGASVATWEELESRVAQIRTTGGNPTDQLLAETVLRQQLEGHGIEQAEFILDHDRSRMSGIRLSTWDDLMAKAKRMIQSGNVQLVINSADAVVGTVQGDHGKYQTQFSRQDPNSQSITMWECECPWDQFAWQRTRQWKKYEGRVCSHVLATYWVSCSVPLDEDRAPGSQPGQTGQMSLFDTAGGQPGSMPLTQAPVGTPGMVPASPQLPLPGVSPGMATGTPTGPQGPLPGVGGPPPGQARPLLPQFPGSPQVQPTVNPVSVPGLKQPTPMNPIQYGGGTFSSWDFSGKPTLIFTAAEGDQFTNGDMVSNKEDEPMAQWVGLNGGATTTIPAGSIGEVRGTDPLGTVEVYFAGPASANGNLQPHGVVGWFFPSQLTRRTDVRPPGPATRRR